MKVDAGLGHQLERVPASAKEVEAMGFDGVRTAEMNHDPFFPLLLAAEHTSKIELISSIAVGFARSPMLLANIGHDLNAYSKGRVTIGLGSQIKPHITKRFSMPWGAPAAKMRELVLAMRAIWANWYDGAKLEFVGKFYNHTLMTPAFTPENKAVRRAEGDSRCGRSAHDRSRGRSGRRHDHSPVQHAAVHRTR